jgi:hypothetical protein
MYILRRLPRVLCLWVAHPFDQVLEPLFASVVLGCEDRLNFPFPFPINQLRGRRWIILSVNRHLLIRREKGGVEGVVELSGGR